MALKRKQRNNDLSDDIMETDSIASDPNGKETSSTPFLSQLFDTLKSPTDNPNSETSHFSDDVTPSDIGDRSNIESPKGSSQTPFLSQLFHTISSSTNLPKKSAEQTDIQAKTNTIDENSKIFIESDVNKTTETFTTQLSETQLKNDEKIKIKETENLNFKKDAKSPENEVGSENRLSETPFLSQLFNSLDNTTPSSGGIIEKDTHQNLDKITDNTNEKIVTIDEKNIKSSPENEAQPENNKPETPFLSQLFNVLDKSCTLSGETNEKSTQPTIGESSSSQVSKKICDDSDNNDDDNSTRIKTSLPPPISQISNAHKDTTVNNENPESNEMDFENCVKKQSVDEVKSEKNVLQTPFLSQLFNSLDKSNHLQGETSKMSKHSTLDETKNDNTERLNSNKNIFKKSVENLSDNKVESEKNNSQTPFLSQLFNVLDKSSPLPGENNKNLNLTPVKSTDGKDDPPTKTALPAALSQLFDSSNKSNLPTEYSTRGKSHSPAENLTNIQDERSSNANLEAPFLSQLFTSISSPKTSNQSKEEYDNSNYKLSHKTHSKYIVEDETELPKKSLPFSEVQCDSNSNTISDRLNSKSISGVETDSFEKSTSGTFLNQLFNTIENKNAPSSQLYDNTFDEKSNKDFINKNIDSKISSKSQSQKDFSEGVSKHIEETDSKPFLSELFGSISNKTTQESLSGAVDDENLHNENHDAVKSETENKPFLSQLFGSISDKTTRESSSEAVDDENLHNKNNDAVKSETENKPFLSQLFGSISNKTTQESSSTAVDDENFCNENHNDVKSETDNKPFLSQLFGSISNNPTTQESSAAEEVDDISLSSEDEENVRYLSNKSVSRKRDPNSFRFDHEFYLHQLELADAVKDGNLKEINENLTTGLVIAAKATGHLVGEIYEWVRKSYPNKSELKLSDIAKQLLLMTKIIDYFNETSFSKNEFEEWMTQLNHPYVFPSDDKMMLWTNVLENDELCHKVDSFLRKKMEIEEHMQNEDDQSESSWNRSEGKYRRSRHQYGSQRDRYEDDYYHSREHFDKPNDQFGSSSNSMNEFDHPRDQWDSTRDNFEYGSSEQERFTPPNAPLNTYPSEYAHWQIPPPQPPELAPTGPKPPPFIIAPSSVPYSGPAANLAPNPPHQPNTMPFGEIAPPVPPPPIPQTLLQMHPPLDFTQITAADPNTSYSNALLPEAWIKAQNLLKCKENLPSCPLPSLPKSAASPPTVSVQNVPVVEKTHTVSSENTSQYNPLIETSNQNEDVSSALQIDLSVPSTTSSCSSNENVNASIPPTKKHKIDIKLKKKRKPDENEESKKSIYICCLPKGLSNDMMRRLLLVCGEVEEFHREIIDGVEAESCVVKFVDVETVFKSYQLLNEFMILDSMLIVAVLNEKLFTDEDKEIDEREIIAAQIAIDLLKTDIENEVMKPNIEFNSSKRSLDEQESVNKKLKFDDEEIYGPECTDIEISNIDLETGKVLMVPVLEKCGGVLKWKEVDGKILFKYKNKLSAVIASQLLRELRIPDKYLEVGILSKEVENLESMDIDKGKKNTMKSWLNQAIVANQEEFVNHLQKFCGMYRLNDFDPFAYKTKMCLEEKCSGNCESYHIPEKKDRRRDPRIYNYSDLECKNTRDGKICPEADMCHKSHTENEREFHESRIHASICRSWEKSRKKCDKKKLCISAHPETPEVLFSEIWHDIYVSGLHQTYQYLEGSVHNLRNIKMEPGAMYVIVVSPSSFMVRWLTKAIRKLAGRHRLRVEEITEEKTAADGATIVIGTPDNIMKMITGSSHRSFLSHVACLILDDVSLLLNKHFKSMKNILNNIMKYSSSELNKIVVSKSIFQSEVDTLSHLLETKFNVIGDILLEGGFSAPQDMKDEKKKEVKKKRYLSPEDRSSRSRSPRSRSPRSKSPLSRSPNSRSPRSYRGHSPGSPRARYRDQSPGSPRSRYRNNSPFSPRFRYRDYSPDHSPVSPRSRYRDHSPSSPRSRYKRHSPGSPRGRYRDHSPGNRSPRSRYRDFSPEHGGPSRSNFSEYPMRNRSHYPPNASGFRGGPSRYNDHYPRGRGRGGPNHRYPRGRGRGGPTHRIGPPMEMGPPMELGPPMEIGPPMEMRVPLEINFPIIDHCYNLRSICDDLGLAGYTLRTIIVKALNLGSKPHKILEYLREDNILVQMNKEAAEFKALEKRADNVLSEENFKHAYIQTKMLIDYLKSIEHMRSVDQYGLNIRRIAIETLNKKIEYVNEEIKVHLRSIRVTPTPKNVFEILAVVLGERSIINASRPKGTYNYDDTDMSSLNDGQSDDDDLEMCNVKKAEPIGGI